MKTPAVSIIVPIYKVESYLSQCVESLLAQTLKNIEIILVDDGSPDACPQMVDAFAARDSRVVAIHQPNGGYGRAVNHGIERARGEYIGIVESDDWIEPDMYETLYARACEDEAELVKCGFFHYDSTQPDGRQDYVPREPHRMLSDAPQQVFSIEDFPGLLIWHPSLWAGLYRADFLRGQRVIESAAASYQDFPFMVEVLCRATRISVVQRRLLHYRMETAQGSSTTATGRRLLMMPAQCLECKRILRQYGKLELLREEFFYHAFSACIGFYRQIDAPLRGEFFSRMQEVVAELEDMPGFSYRYFSDALREDCRRVQQGGWFNRYRVLVPGRKELRRLLFTLRLSRKGFCLTLLGLQIATPAFRGRTALWRIHLP